MVLAIGVGAIGFSRLGGGAASPELCSRPENYGDGHKRRHAAPRRWSDRLLLGRSSAQGAAQWQPAFEGRRFPLLPITLQMDTISECRDRWLRALATRQQALENMMFSRAFCDREFGRRYCLPARRRVVCRSVTPLPDKANRVLPQQIERDGEQNDVLHHEGHVARHRREASCGDVPAFRHERNDRNRRDESAGRPEGAEDAEPLVPEASEQQGPERPLRDAQEIACAGVAEDRIEPPDQRSVADVWDQSPEIIRKPLLVG